MSETLKDPEPPDKDRAAGSQSTARTCPACGAAYFGPFHKGCPGSKPAPARPASAESSIDEIPAEAKAYETDASRQLNQYILVKQVGRGGMGAVWKAWDRNLTRWAAVKFLLAHEQNDILRFQREAKLAARLRHSNIAAIYEVGHAKSAQLGSDVTHYLAMEFIDGRSLHEATLSIREVAALFIKISAGIEAAHRGGVIHRDLKPQNIMLNAEGWPYVMDFGLAKALQGDSSLSVSGAVMGTPAYMPPEQAEGRLEEIDARSDVYSLGATLYSVLCRRPPFGGQNPLDILNRVSQQEPPSPSSLNKEIPPALEHIILKSMSKAKPDRYASVSDFAKDLERYLANETVKAAAQGAYDPTVIARPVPPKRRGLLVPVIIGLGVVLGGVVVLLSGGGTPMPTPPPPQPQPVVKAPEPPPTKPEPKPEPKVEPVVKAPEPKPVEPPPPPPKPEPKPEPKVEPPPPPPKVDEDEKTWKQSQALLGFDAWTPGDVEFPKRTNALLARYLPKEASREAVVARWFSAEIEKARGLHRQGNRTPEQQQTQARRIAAWLDALTGALGGIDALQDVRRSVDALRSEVETQIRGKFKLTIAPVPFAEVTRITCDGRLLKLQKRETPVVLNGLEIGDYEIELDHPDLGKRSVKIGAKELRDGRAYSVSGKMSDPSLKVTELPQ